MDQGTHEAPPEIAWGSSALRDIASERRRQIEAEGWTPEHDDEHTFGELVQAAADLCVDGTDFRVVDMDGDRMIGWGLTERHKDDRRRQLVIAGALIVAEIERRDRMDIIRKRRLPRWLMSPNTEAMRHAAKD